MALPSVVLILGLCLNAIGAVALRVQLVDVAAQSARLLGRGDDASAVLRGWPSPNVEHADGVICVELERAVGFIPVRARGCALEDGQ